MTIEKEPIWPMSEEELVQWKKEQAVASKVKSQEVSILSVAEKAMYEKEKKTSADTFKAEMKALRHELAPVKTTTTAATTEQPRRQNRLGQTHEIDILVKEGKNDQEIEKILRQKIPAYPAEKWPKLIKLRRYHLKNDK